MLHKRIDFTKLGGMPLTQDVLRIMQESYKECLDNLMQFFGENIKLSGLEYHPFDNSWTSGWAIVGGNLYYVAGGIGRWLHINDEQATSLVYNNGQSQQAIFVRSASVQSEEDFDDFELLDAYDRETLVKPSDLLTITNQLATAEATISTLNVRLNNLENYVSNIAWQYATRKSEDTSPCYDIGLQVLQNGIYVRGTYRQAYMLPSNKYVEISMPSNSFKVAPTLYGALNVNARIKMYQVNTGHYETDMSLGIPADFDDIIQVNYTADNTLKFDELSWNEGQAGVAYWVVITLDEVLTVAV
ncbi:MAG: hypothetical protein LBR66_04045 [Candidatus Symbiothrix sp.]|jgi:hypothetical protein|nr:hypothetical protein [Candidatus Symbiothrix sp.]